MSKFVCNSGLNIDSEFQKVWFVCSFVSKMEMALFFPSKLIAQRKFKMFEFGTNGGCIISKQIPLLNIHLRMSTLKGQILLISF